VLLLKLLLAPAFVVAVSLLIRRVGPALGGLAGGLPVVAGPILFVYALEHGAPFAADAAAASLAALAALSAFVAAAARLQRLGAVAAVVIGWIVFLTLAALLAAWSPPPLAALVVALVAFAAALAGGVPAPATGAAAGPPVRPRHDLLLRAGLAAAMVLVLTTVAGRLGPEASGVLAPFPTITSVLAGFAIAHAGETGTLLLLRGMVRGFFSFAAFCLAVALAIEPLGVGAAFGLALLATVAVQGALLLLARTQAARQLAPAQT